jgi:hypothetical protein
MAGNLRDFTLRFLSAVDRFDLTKPADELEQLADATGAAGDGLEQLDRTAQASRLDAVGTDAADAGRKLDGLGDDAKGAGAKLDGLATDAKATAAKVDGAFDKIAASSSATAKDVRGDMKRAGGALDEFKDEAGSSGREAAASFSGGFGDITDFVQETAANALGGLGPIGAAAGVAAAAGIGLLTAQLEKANQRIQDVRTTLQQLGSDAPELDKVNAALDVLRENGDLEGLKRALNTAGVSFKDYVDALVNGGPKVDAIKAKLYDLGDTAGGFGTIYDENARGAQSAWDALDQYRQGAQQAAGDIQVASEVTAELTAEQERATAQAERLAAAQQTVTDALGTVADATPALNEAVQNTAQKQADATKSTKDSWQDYADGVELSAAQVVKVLDEQTKAAENFRDNLLETQKRGDAEFTAWVSKQPAAVAAAYAEGTAKEKQAIYDAFRRNVGAQQGAGVAAGLTGTTPAAVGAAGRMFTAIESELTGSTIYVPVDFQVPTAGEALAVRARMKRQLEQPLNIPVRYQDVGNYRRVP